MSTTAVPQNLQLPPSQRAQSSFKEQRRQKFKEHLLKRKSLLTYKQENQISRVMTSEDQVQQGTKLLKRKTKMADKENIRRHSESTNTMEKNCILLKASNELTNSTTTTETHNFENDNQTLQLLPIKNDSQSQNVTLSQAFHHRNNGKKKQMTAEKPKQDASIFKKPVLGCYRGQIVQSKVNSFRKPLQVKDEHFATTKKLSTTVSKGTKSKCMNTSSVTIQSDRAPNTTTTTKFMGTTSQNTQLARPPIRSHSNNQNRVKQDINRTSANVTFQKRPSEKELLQSKIDLSSVKTSSQDTKSKPLQSKSVLPCVKTTSQDIKRSKALFQNISSEPVARPLSFAVTKVTEKSEAIDQRRHTIAKTTVDRSAQPKETAEERRARLSEWRASKGRVLRRPPTSVVTQPEPERQNETPVRSFWTTMAEEDEQRLFTDKVNRTFSECLNLINKGCPKEEIMTTLNDLIKNIPDAKKLVKYWICLIRIESITSPIENIISIYEKAILAGAQPIEEMRQTIVDIITMKNQEKRKYGENIEDADRTEEQIQEINTEDTGVNLEPRKPEVENKHNRNVVFQDCEKQQDDRTKDPADSFKTPDTENRSSCLIKYNISTTPYLQSIKKKMQLDETNSAFKELKFLTPVRRSRRLQEKISKLPDMLKDHYPCVSSLEQLSELGGESDAFVCRPNVALCPVFTEADIAEEK
ncbi:cytoskeleton-associated protein 2 isoform X2 [Fukomys damarensis]|uniref:cytoskeleton-associated protein 2 isoform X2 n=1 Tax=Fukomys damarensis TaxID=885580 RepID=UPI00053F388B|nr:cytoskeleton-associated protein 2 isoform X2 [Fukomys damarensis]